MKIYHSFWEYGWNNFNEKVYNMHKLSVLLAKLNYGNITLITTLKGKELLGDLPYTNIELFEDHIDPRLSDTWSISKMYAYKQIIKKEEPFYHIDYDVFLFKRMPEWFENSPVVYQNIEAEGYNEFYNFDIFFENCKNLYVGDTSVRYAYNMGIFGGRDFDSLQFYIDEAFKLFFDPQNLETWWLKLGLPIAHGCKSTLIEQWYLACCLKKLGITPTPLFKGEHEFDTTAIEYGYCHVWGEKHNDEIHEKIKDKIREYE